MKATLDTVLLCPNLPTLPNIAVELLKLTRDPDVSLDEIGKLVRMDQGLASRLLRTVNSSHFGLAQPCNSIERALAFLGLKSVKSLVLGFSLVQCTKSIEGSQDGLDILDYWPARVIYGAAGAMQFAAELGGCDSEEAFLGALFQDMGVLALQQALASDYDSVVASAGGEHDALAACENAALGFDHPTVGAALAEKWRLPDEIVACVRHHHEPDSAGNARNLVRTVALARLASESLREGSSAEATAEFFRAAQEWFGRERDEMTAMLEPMVEAAEELAKLFDIDVGGSPDLSQILLEANQLLVEQQMAAQAEMSQLRRRQDDLEKESKVDTLTGVSNRRGFDARMKTDFEAASESKTSLAVVFSDADRFKAVNDTHGHQAGDVVLAELGHRLKETVGKRGMVARYGGEEFAIILPDADVALARDIAEEIRVRVESEVFDLTNVEGAPDELTVTISLGVSAAVPGEAGSPAEPSLLVAEADKAVYAAKEAGRNRVCVFERSVAVPGGGNVSVGGSGNSERTIWILMSDPLAARLLQAVFARLGRFEIVTASTLEVTRGFVTDVQQARRAAPALVLSDVTLCDGGYAQIVETCSSMVGTPRRMVVLGTAARGESESSTLGAESDGFHLKERICDELARWASEIVQSLDMAKVAA